MFEQFRGHFPITKKKWNEYISCFSRIQVPSRTIVLKEGEISKKGFIIEKGCLRAWLNQDGADKTIQFFFENDTFSSVESFRKNVPSMITIETIEACTLWAINKKDAERIISEINEQKALRNLFINAMFERTFHYMKHYISFIKDTPTQRYLNIINTNPQIVLRVPQHYIASYLGISTVHLSRLKNKLAKEKNN